MPIASQARLILFHFIIRTKQVVLSSPAGDVKWVKEVGKLPKNHIMKRSWPKGWPGRRGVGGLRDELIQPYFLTDAGRMWKE